MVHNSFCTVLHYTVPKNYASPTKMRRQEKVLFITRKMFNTLYNLISRKIRPKDSKYIFNTFIMQIQINSVLEVPKCKQTSPLFQINTYPEKNDKVHN